MAFVADVMLGRLARWMRFLGFDVLYFRDIDDRELVRISRAEGRVLLTRDRGLPRDFTVRCLLVGSEDLKAQLTEVLSVFPPDANAPRRCMRCNGELEEVEGKESVRDHVPEYVYIHHDSFLRCTGCDALYWEGSHPRNIREEIGRISAEMGKAGGTVSGLGRERVGS